jgi:fructokinase
MERESNRRIISLDPNIRPAVISNRDAYRQRFESWLAYVDILRLSTADLDWLYPGTDWHALLPGWIESGVKLVLVTEGARGASGVSSSGEIVFVPAIQVEVSDTVGAGDTFLAGALAYLHDHNLLYDRSRLASLPTDDMRTCLEYASRAAAINCTRAGANPPYKHEMVS